MSGQSSSGSVGNLVIEPREFARRGEVRGGSIPIAKLPRVAEMALDQDAVFTWQARGEVGSEGEGLSGRRGWFLSLTVSGALALRCERCLESIRVPVEIEARFLMVPSDQPLPDEELEEDRFDAISVGEELNLAELIEDEMLLSLPVSPRHASCALPGPAENSDRKSPFAVLAQLKRGH